MEVSRYCLDTSAYSNFKRADPQIVEIIDSAEWLGVPAIVIGELWTGFLLGRRRARNDVELRESLANPAVEELSVDGEVGRIYAEIVVQLGASDAPIPTNDIWIAALATRAGATVLTHDDHFHAVARVGSFILSPCN